MTHFLLPSYERGIGRRASSVWSRTLGRGLACRPGACWGLVRLAIVKPLCKQWCVCTGQTTRSKRCSEPSRAELAEPDSQRLRLCHPASACGQEMPRHPSPLQLCIKGKWESIRDLLDRCSLE